MAKPPRSPLLGYNHNVKYGGHIFHVQTEDSGPGNPHIFTHLFFEGSILASKRGQYDPGLVEDEVRTMMQAQHKAILKELKQKSYDQRIASFFEMRGQTFRFDELSTDRGQATVPEAASSQPAPPEQPAAPVDTPAMLDLDALPGVPGGRAATPEPLPIQAVNTVAPSPGAYTFRRSGREQPPREATAPPPSTASARPAPTRPITPVVVQRQVIVGGGATSTGRKVSTPVRRRPVSGGPYVVKEGSHADIPGSVQRAQAAQQLVAPAEPSKAPRTADTNRAPQEGAPSSYVTDQSLDDVILAYLSQGEGKR